MEKINWPSLAGRGKKWLLPTVAAIIFILAALIAGNALAFFETSYLDRFYPNTKIGSIDLSGLTKNQAFDLLNKISEDVSRQSIQVKYSSDSGDQIILLDQFSNPDSASNYLDYDVYRTVYDNFNVGRTGNWLKRLADQWLLWQGYRPAKAVLKLDKDYVRKTIAVQLSDSDLKAVDAAPRINCLNGNCQVDISSEKSGQSFNYDQALGEWEKNLELFRNSPIELEKIILNPTIKKAEAEVLIGRLSDFLLSSSTPEFHYQDKSWRINKTDLAKVIKFESGRSNIYLSVDEANFSQWFRDNIGQEIDIPAQNATVKISGGRVASLSAHKSGQAADFQQAFLDFKTKVINYDFNDLNFELKVVSTEPEVMTENINDLGIKEILGIGESSFAGSPTNRRKNIKNGSNRLNGLLIKPDEEFSLVKTLLPVDASTGYFPELVIKGNKTVPEYGGGLCQIGTTVFRAALSSGLPILERQNHSYSVTYYLEGGLPGVDATIYDPKPDLRFKNDTGGYILIQSYIVGDKLYFEFWGNKDGRTVIRTKPRTWGLKSPPPTKIVESTDLAPGQKKCTETAHKGISAAFDYIVDYPDGRTATTTFTSVYKPWQEVCLVGVTAAATSTTEADVAPVDNP
ncbi:MAG: VanW family protein [Patescibacteria group bacterium]